MGYGRKVLNVHLDAISQLRCHLASGRFEQREIGMYALQRINMRLLLDGLDAFCYRPEDIARRVDRSLRSPDGQTHFAKRTMAGLLDNSAEGGNIVVVLGELLHP